MQRVAAIRNSNTNQYLDPVDSVMLTQYDPTIFERTGDPTCYEEIANSTTPSTKQIKVFPTPSRSTDMLIVGIRKWVALSADSDVVVPRGIDNAIIALALSDALIRLRNYAKSDQKLQAGKQLLADAIAAERARANFPRRTKPLTVAGNSLAELTDAVAARTNQWTPESTVLIKEYLRRNYQRIYDSFLWAESVVVARVSTDGQQIIFPEYFQEVISVRLDDNSTASLVPADVALYFRIAPNIFETIGTSVNFSKLTAVATRILSPGREALTLKSTNPADICNVFIRGEESGHEASETVVLQGITTVNTVHTYDTVLTFSKPQTVGEIILTGAASSVELQRLLPNERERKQIRVWIQPNQATQDPATKLLALGKRTIQPLVQDEDTPIIRNIQDALITAACSNILAATDKTASDSFMAQSQAAVSALIDLERKQGANLQRIIPYVDPGYAATELEWSKC
jgi:hypothetical protein